MNDVAMRQLVGEIARRAGGGETPDRFYRGQLLASGIGRVSVGSPLSTKSYVMVIARTAVLMTRMGERRATYPQ